MGKLTEILQSGIAPGIKTGASLIPAAQAALKGLKELENEPGYKHGPPRGARAIEKHFGMPASFVRKKWETPFLGRQKIAQASIALLLSFLCLTSKAGYITSGETFINGQTVFAADLNNAINNATIGPGFYLSFSFDGSPSSANQLLEYNPGIGGFQRITLLNIFTNSYPFITAVSGTPSYTTNDLFIFYSVTGSGVQSITFSNLLNDVSLNLPVDLLSFANTNNTAAAYSNDLSVYPTPFYPTITNNQPWFIVYGTNGILYTEPYSNVINNAQGLIDTNALTWTFDQMFFPWTIYGTNNQGPGFTNAFGYTTNFPITALNMTSTWTNSLNALTDTDKIPIQAGQQGNTNTTVTTLALFEYTTNKLGLPPYTQARCKFSGFHVAVTITNMNSLNGIITNISLQTSFTNPEPVSFTGASPQMPTVPQITSNVVYWAYATNSPNNAFQLYTNQATALSRIDQITGNGVTPANSGQMLYVTNFTSFNSVVVPWSGTSSVDTGAYLMYFIVPSATAYYYITGSASVSTVGGGNNSWEVVSSLFSTNQFVIETTTGGSAGEVPLVDLMAFPQ